VAEGLAGVPEEEEEIDTSWVTADNARQLVAAVIIRALRDATPTARRKEPSTARNAVQKDALAWLRSRDTQVWSCRWACDELGLNHDAIVRALDDPSARLLRAAHICH
jgi:hypothetical protein